MNVRQFIASVACSAIAVVSLSGAAGAQELKADTDTQSSGGSQTDWTSESWEALNFLIVQPGSSYGTRR